MRAPVFSKSHHAVFRYVLFIALVFLPSFAVTVASSLGIWSLCVRQLNTPWRARLVRDMPPDSHAYNLEEEENGRVQVRRDITDEFSCCVPGLFCGGSSSSSNSSTINSSSRAEMDGESSCLRHLVQNSSLIFVEGFVTTIQPSSSSIVSAPPAPDRREDVAEERRLVRPHELLTVPPRRNTPTTKTNGRRRRSENPPSGQRAPDDNGPDGVPETKIPLIRTCSDPALSTNPLPKRVISSSSSILSAGSSHEELFQRARGFFLNRVLLADSPQLSKSLCGEDGHEEGSRLLSTEMCSSVFRAGISLQVTR